MSKLIGKSGVGAKFEAELWRNGKLVTDEEMQKTLEEKGIRPKRKPKYLTQKIPGGFITIELKPR